MTVSELIQKLKQCDPDLELRCFWDAAFRTDVDVVLRVTQPADRYDPEETFIGVADKSDFKDRINRTDHFAPNFSWEKI